MWMVDVATDRRFLLLERRTSTSQRQDRMRLYLFDVPDGLSMRILAVEIVAPKPSSSDAVAGSRSRS